MRAFRLTIALAALSVAPTACGGRTGTQAPTSKARTVQVVEPREPSITPDADGPLRAMSDYLASLQRFSLHTEGSLEVVLTDGQKLAFPYESEVWVRRPNGLRSERSIGTEHLQFVYDGRQFTLYGKRSGLYAQYPAPPTIDEAIEVARAKLDLEAPAADLLTTDPYAVLTEDVISGSRVGIEEIDGVRCHHLAFRGNEVDWQIWIEDGDRPLPRRFVITSKRVQGSPQFTVEMTKWNTSGKKARAKLFAFDPPSGAERIEFITSDTPVPKETTATLPSGCTTMPGPVHSCAGGKTYRPRWQGPTLVYVPSDSGEKK